MMAPSQTLTSTATESGPRFASSDTYCYDGTLHLTGTTATPIPARRYTLNVNATNAGSGSGSGVASASHDSEPSTTHDRHAQCHSQSYSQRQRQDEVTQSHLQQARTRSSQSQYWSVRIAEIPIDAAEADAGSPAGYAQNRDSPPDHSHVGYYSGLYASAVAGPSVPPSLARYALTPPAARASSWRDTVIGFPSSSSRTWLPPPPPPFPASDAFRGFDTSTQWDSPPPPSSAEVVASTSFPLVHPSLALPRASPTHSNSPESASGTAASSSWPSIPTATVDSEESTRSRSASAYASKVSSTAPAAVRPSLTRSSFVSSSSSSSSLQVSSFSGSGSNAAPAPTFATTTSVAAAVGATAASCVVPEPATPFALLPFNPQSPESPRRAPGVASEPDASFTSFAAVHPQNQTASTVVSALTPPILSEQQQQTRPSPPFASQTHSPASARLARSDASPGHEQQQHETATFQVPLQTSIGTGDRAGASPSSGFGSVATASGPPGLGAANYPFVGTNTGSYSSPFGVSSDTGAGPSSLAARSAVLLLTVPAAISAAEPFDYSTSSPPLVPVPVPVPASASASAAGCNSGQTTRKKNHACWMCHKSFDRPSTLRKHLLVHTGEKAFVCTICGRRFGVASNLNRHTRRCIARPVNSSAFHSTSTPTAGPSTLATTLLATSDTDESMAREQTNPDVRRSERERDGREVRDGDPPPPAPATPTTSESSTLPTRGRRRGRSIVQSAPVGAQGMNTSLPPESGGSSSQRTPFQLRPAFGAGAGGQGSGQVAVATASASTEDADGERRPKRRRRAPSPSRWVPASLRPFSLSPVRQRTSTPLPPVSPGYDASTGNYEERDSYASVADENVDPAGEANATASAVSSSAAASGSNTSGNAGRSPADRMRNFEYAPYHPCGWTGRLPGPAVVVGTDLTNYAKPSGGGGSGLGSGRYSGGHAAGGLSFMYEFSLAAEGLS